MRGRVAAVTGRGGCRVSTPLYEATWRWRGGDGRSRRRATAAGDGGAHVALTRRLARRRRRTSIWTARATCSGRAPPMRPPWRRSARQSTASAARGGGVAPASRSERAHAFTPCPCPCISQQAKSMPWVARMGGSRPRHDRRREHAFTRARSQVDRRHVLLRGRDRRREQRALLQRPVRPVESGRRDGKPLRHRSRRRGAISPFSPHLPTSPHISATVRAVEVSGACHGRGPAVWPPCHRRVTDAPPPHHRHATAVPRHHHFTATHPSGRWQVPLGAHHLDLMFSDPADPPAVRRVRDVEVAAIREWVGAARSTAA